MADLDVTVGVDTAAAEEGLRRLSAQFHREIASIDRAEAEAKVTAGAKGFKREFDEIKAYVKELRAQRAIAIEVEGDTTDFDSELAAVQSEIAAMNKRKIVIDTDIRKLKEANTQMTLSAKRQEAMAKQTERLQRVREREQATVRKGIQLQSRAIDEDRRREVSLAKLRQEFGKLAAEEERLANRTGRPFGIFRTPGEERDLDLVRAKMIAVEHEVKNLGGSINDIDPDLEHHNSILGRWITNLTEVRLHMGFFSANLKQLGAALVILGPPLTGLLGSATSLVGVLGTGIAGAAAVGSAALVGFGAAALGAFAIIKPIVGEVKEATKASEAYHKAVLKYGEGSEQAATAQEKLAQTLKGISPGARAAIKEVGSLKDRWRDLTSSARKPVFEAAAASLKTVNDLMPLFARNSVKGIDIVTQKWEHWMSRLRSGSGKQGLDTIFSNFNRSLPSVLDGFEHLANIFGRITVSASKLLPSLGEGFEHWAADLDHSVDRGADLDDEIRRLVEHMRDLGHLGQAAGRLLITLFDASADSGDNLVETLTALLNHWAGWMQTLEGRNSLREFFSSSAEESKTLFSFLGRIIGLLFQMGRVTAPLSDFLFKILNAAASILDAASDVGALNAVVKTTAKVMATIWAIGKVKAFTAEVRSAAAAMGLLNVAGSAGAARGAAASGTRVAQREGEMVTTGAVVGAAGGKGMARGMAGALKSVNWAGLGIATVGVLAADEIIGAFEEHAKEKSDNMVEALGARAEDRSFFGAFPVGKDSIIGKLFSDAEDEAAGKLHDVFEELSEGRTKIGKAQEKTLRQSAAEVDLTEKQKRSVQEMLRIARLGRTLHVRIAGDQSPEDLQKLVYGFRALRSGALASLGDINKVMQQNASLIAQTLPRGSEEARRKTAENFRSAADAIKKAMDNGLISVKKGTERMRDLIRNARLVEGNDPLGLAKGFAKSWESAGGINKKNRERIIGELQKMPPRARDEAYRFMLQFGKGLVRGGKIPAEDLRLFKSRAITEIQGIGSGFSGLDAVVFEAFKNIGSNLSKTLRSLGGAPKFNLKLLHMLPKLPPLEQQQGGFTVPGSGSGDKVPKALPYGSFVMNREASKAYGFTTGGHVQTILEPKERVFLPNEVKAIGPHNLMAMNEAVPRQKGGSIGPMPIVQGRESDARRVGQLAVQKVYSAAEHYLQRHRPKTGAGGYSGPAFGPEGTSSYKGVLMATWVRQALEYGARHGSGDPQPTSGYRSHAQNVSEGRNYFSEHEKTQYPGGAVDFGGMVDPASLPAKMAVVNATRNFKYPLLAPAGFRDDGHASGTGHMGGGFALSTGGPTPPPGGMLVGASYYGGPSDSTSGTVGSSGVSLPGKMSFAELAMGKALGGLPYHTKLKIGYSGKSVVAEKLDIGAGGGAIGGKNRAIDLWYETAQALGMSGSGVVNVAPADGSAVSGGGHAALPKSVKVKHPVYVAGKGGAKTGGTTAGTKKMVESTVALDVPDFGPLPTEEGAIRKELSELSHRTLPEYRAALRQHSKNKQIAEKLQASLKKIEGRIRELRDKLREIRYAKAKKRVSRKQARQLGQITGQEGGIEAARRRYEERDQYASQIVAQEPEENGNVTEDWVERVFEPYINNQERPAYESVLGAENDWRNAILTAENIAEGIEKNWETQIGYPERGRKPDLLDPNLHFPPRQKNQQATGLAGWIYGLHDQMERIRAFANSHTPKWWSEHPAAKSQRDGELRDLQTYFKPKFNFAMFRRQGLVSNLGEGRESFNYFAGTGSFEDSLQDVQGLHWPDQHTKLGSLPGTPVPGVFGGAIWDTQEAIQDLGIRIQQAKESLSGSEPDRGAELKAFEEAIRGLAAGRPFVSINQGSPWLGAFAQGGVALVGERGPELAHLPHGTRIHDAEDTARLLEPNVVVDVSRLGYGPFGAQGLSPGAPHGKVINVDQKNYFPTPPPDPHTWAKGNVFELEAMAS